MPKRPPINRRTWIAAWAALCAAGLAATAALNSSSAQATHPEDPARAECAGAIADFEKQLAKTRQNDEGDEGAEKVHTLTAVSIGTKGEGTCHDELVDHFKNHR
ncbi:MULTISPECIES: hypothetical protein [unclassified Streptomyces]|uniref:hypothetical protein n=1 Tax=unclassified Streptomyces TaxID=2593676 RepID=UPI00278C7CD4|nr:MULTISPECIES: hypothetical protein [unclassified Streptomyces]